MSITGFFLKHPDGIRSYTFDFSADIPENDSLNDYALTVVNSAGDDVLGTAEVTVFATINTDTIDVEFSGGIDGENYRITMIAALGTSTTKPTKIIEMRVRSEDV